MSSAPGTIVPVDLTMGAAPFGWGGNLAEFVELFAQSISGALDPAFLIGQTYGTMPTHDIGPYFDGEEWWFFDPATGQYEPGEQGCAIGTIALFGGYNIPPRWLQCNGTAISRRTYYRLFGAIGETWGPGDGESTFNLPPGGKIYLSAAGFVALEEVAIDNPLASNQAAPGAEATSSTQIQTYPSQGVGSRGGQQLNPNLIATDMPGIQINQSTDTETTFGLEAAMWIVMLNISNALSTDPSVNIPNLQAAGAGSEYGTFSMPIVDENGNVSGAKQSNFSTMPPFVSINHMIKYQ